MTLLLSNRDSFRRPDENRGPSRLLHAVNLLVPVVFVVGMRDFAVAAALVVAAGFPSAAALPAVCFGIVEMTTSSAIAWLAAHR